MGIPLKKGRLIAASDTASAPPVLVIDERLAKRFWGNRDPIGKRMWKPETPDDLTKGPGAKVRYLTVVGVVANIRTRGLTEKEPVGTYYYPAEQNVPRSLTLVVRAAAGDPSALGPSLRRELAAIDPELPLYNIRPMGARIDQSLMSRRTPMLLAVLFGAIALFLAAVGIYGVLAYQVSQRRRELGIRLALGSDASRIFALVVREGLLLLGAGLVAGLAGAVAIRKAMEAQLFGIRPMDPGVLAAVAALLAIVALTASAVPARRASRIDPLIALTDQ